jgi:hypothetical protein
MSGIRATGVASLFVIAAMVGALSSCGSTAGPNGVGSPRPSISGTPGGATAVKSAGPSATPPSPSAVRVPSGPATAAPSQSTGADPQNPVDLRKPTAQPTGSSR